MIIRRAYLDEIQKIGAFGRTIPELKVSNQAEFMSDEEINAAIVSGIFLVAEENNEIIGFIYADLNDPDRIQIERQACLVYLAVKKERRNQGVATKLYDELMIALKNIGIKYIYAWANLDSGVIEFLEKRKFLAGNVYRWMDLWI